MKKILIVGNGFDLYHGLPTRYTDFLSFAEHWDAFIAEYNCNKDKVHKGSALSQNDFHLSERGEMTDKAMQAFAKYSDMLDEKHIAFLDKNLKENCWIKYFECNLPSGKNWIDFEREIEALLKQVEILHNRIISREPGGHSDRIWSSVRKAICIFGASDKEFYKMLFSPNPRFNPDKEDVTENKKALISVMLDQLNALNKCLEYYMSDFISLIPCNGYSQQIMDLDDVFLLNFNYTYTYATVYGKQRLKEHHPVHGEAKESNLVLGIQDDAFPDTNEYIYFQKYFQRIQKRTGNIYKRWLEMFDPNDENEVYIIGHSLSPFDKGILQDFFLNESVVSIKIFYHKQEAYEDIVINLISSFGKDFVIENTGTGRIVFEELKPLKAGRLKR